MSLFSFQQLDAKKTLRDNGLAQIPHLFPRTAKHSFQTQTPTKKETSLQKHLLGATRRCAVLRRGITETRRSETARKSAKGSVRMQRVEERVGQNDVGVMVYLQVSHAGYKY